MTRRLAAILAADVVGYSALMAEDEAGTLEALRRMRAEVFGPAVAGHRGKVIKSMGDGWMVEFGAAADAVNCALRLQEGLADDTTIRVRIGIHIGDITHVDEDIYGDGVNIAARLESLADPGAVTISGSVYASLDGTLKPAFDDCGEQQLKNISEPVRVWVRGAMRKAPGLARRRKDLPQSFPVLAIRPVRTSDPRDEVMDLANALASDLHTYLGSTRWISAVITETPPTGAYSLECVLRARGPRLRLEADLYDPQGTTIWTRRVDGDLADSFDWQDGTAADLTSGTYGMMHSAEKKRLSMLSPAQMNAETCLLQGYLMTSMQRDDLELAIGFIEQAVEKSPDWGMPYGVGLIQLYGLKVSAPADEQDRHDALLDTWLRRADETLDPDSPHRIMVAFFRHLRAPDPASLRAVLDKALKRSEHHQDVRIMAQIAAFALGDPQLALDFARKALQFVTETVQAAVPTQYIAMASVMLGRDETALTYARKAIAILPHFVGAHITAAAAHAHLGQMDEARDRIAAALELAPGTTVATLKQHRGWPDTPEIRRYMDGARMAGLPD